MNNEQITQSRKVTHARKTFKSKFFVKNPPKHTTTDYIGFAIIIMLMTNGAIFGTLHVMKQQLHAHKQESIYDKCRIKQFVTNEDNTKTYTCQSQTKDEIYFIHENESIKIKQNPYVNRPVTIYKNGKIE